MSGNSEIGSAPMDTSPLSTVMIAITMATMGRRTKKAAMLLALRSLFGHGRQHGGIDDGAFAQLRGGIDQHALLGRQAARHHPAVADAAAQRDRAQRHLVFGI